jgi:predicted aspartyl protease
MAEQARDEERRVSLTYIDATVTGPAGEQVTLRFLIDTGAEYSLLPHDVWRHLGLAPKRMMRFNLADGTLVERAISECHIAVDDTDGHTPVILGEPGDVALFGAVTFEVLGLVFNPFDRSLRPMTTAPLMLLTA